MTVTELIEKLKEMPSDMPVKRKNLCGDYGETKVDIYQVEIMKNKYDTEWVEID